MKQAICDFISQSLMPPGSNVTLSPTDDLLTVGMLDSIQLMRLVEHLETQNAIKIPAEDLLLENFQTVDQIDAYLTRRTANG